MQKGFIEAELTLDGAPVAFTDENGENAFKLYRLCERVRKVQRYSYQRPFTEAYSLTVKFQKMRRRDNPLLPKVKIFCRDVYL